MRDIMEEEVKREGGVKSRGTVGAVVVKVTSLPCEVEWYLNLTFAGTMSLDCHSLAVCRWVVCVFVQGEPDSREQIIVCNNELNASGSFVHTQTHRYL